VAKHMPELRQYL